MIMLVNYCKGLFDLKITAVIPYYISYTKLMFLLYTLKESQKMHEFS